MIKMALVALLSMFATSAFANDAGCGLGSLVISSNGKLMQLFAVTTNSTFGSQTLGITFGTSNCSSRGLVSNDREIQYFVEVNQEDLSREIAQGSGEKLNTLAVLHGCSSHSSVQLFSERAQSDFAQLIPTKQTTAVELVTNLKSSQASQACVGG